MRLSAPAMIVTLAASTGLPLLGELPLESSLGRSTDEGAPVVAANPDDPASLRFREIARRTAGRLARQALNTEIRMPKITITD